MTETGKWGKVNHGRTTGTQHRIARYTQNCGQQQIPESPVVLTSTVCHSAGQPDNEKPLPFGAESHFNAALSAWKKMRWSALGKPSSSHTSALLVCSAWVLPPPQLDSPHFIHARPASHKRQASLQTVGNRQYAKQKQRTTFTPWQSDESILCVKGKMLEFIHFLFFLFYFFKKWSFYILQEYCAILNQNLSKRSGPSTGYLKQ